MKLKFISLLILLLLISLSLVLHFHHKYQEEKEQRIQAVKFAKADETQATWYKNKLGAVVMQVERLQLSVKNANELLDKEKLRNLFQPIKIKRIESAAETEVKFENTWNIPLSTGISLASDTARLRFEEEPQTKFSFYLEDSLTIIQGYVDLENFSVQPQIMIDIPIYEIRYWERGKFLGLVRMWPAKKKFVSDLTTTNPNAEITKHKVIDVKR